MWEITNVGFFTLVMTLATVNVLPEPVTPSNVWCLRPFSRPVASFSIACGWSPVGLYSDVSSNFMTKLHYIWILLFNTD